MVCCIMYSNQIQYLSVRYLTSVVMECLLSRRLQLIWFKCIQVYYLGNKFYVYKPRYAHKANQQRNKISVGGFSLKTLMILYILANWTSAVREERNIIALEGALEGQRWSLQSRILSLIMFALTPHHLVWRAT